MASIWKHGRTWWCRLKQNGEWISRSTECSLVDERGARAYAKTAQETIDRKERGDLVAGPPTVATYAESWLKDRRARGVRTVRDDEGRINNHVIPVLGGLRMDEVKPRHLRDLVRALVAAKDIAPRTIINVYSVTGTMFRDAVVEEMLVASPCVLKRGELPGKTDKDPEWRVLATYESDEVRQLVTATAIPPERRVQYAMKALAGLRHGEAAGARWRHYDPTLKPLGRLVVTTSYNTGRTKTEVPRRVPVHPTLAKILDVWRAQHWERVYGHAPTVDDLIIPTRTMEPVDATDAGRAFIADLDRLELRTTAGQHRKRGGHDLRAWFITTAQEYGAHRDLLRIATHPGKGDVVSGYTRATWAALCAEVVKLVFVLDGEPLQLATGFATTEASVRKRWSKMATPTGFERLSSSASVHDDGASERDRWTAAVDIERSHGDAVAGLLQTLARAVIDGDELGARRLANEALAVDGAAARRAG